MELVKKKKIEWLAMLQGFSMLLVVIGHVSLTNVYDDPKRMVVLPSEIWKVQ